MAFLRAKSLFVGLAVFLLLLFRVPRAVVALARSLHGLRLAEVERALELPLAERIRSELGRLTDIPGTSGNPGWTLYRLGSERTPSDALIYVHSPNSETAYDLTGKLAQLLYPRILVFENRPGEDWAPDLVTERPIFVLALAQQGPARWKETAVVVEADGACELWRVGERRP